jgi:hypothetical protein
MAAFTIQTWNTVYKITDKKNCRIYLFNYPILAMINSSRTQLLAQIRHKTVASFITI